MTGWEDAAEHLAEAVPERGLDIADLVASAWRARVDPYATRSLVSAACTLAGPAVMRRMWGRVDPCPGDWALLSGAQEIEADVAGMLRHARKMAGACEETRDRAASDYAAAVLCGTTAPASRAALVDCDAALDILEVAQEQLKQALDSLRQLPAELADTYEAAYDLVRGGGKLPHSGHFLTGAA